MPHPIAALGRTRRRNISMVRANSVQDASLEARLGGKVEIQPDGCWAYLGDLHTRHLVRVGPRNVDAHRWFYETLIGPIEGQQLHHTCGHLGCVNPSHLSTTLG